MKTFFKSFFKFIQSIFLQVLLGIVAIASFVECRELGYDYQVGTYDKELNYDKIETVGTTITAGFNGGAFAMGIICSVCIIMIVWLEINKQNRK
jgi:hypothetical protein